jgi:small subunit ribosomal protein S10
MKCCIKLKSFNPIILEAISDICLNEAKKAKITKAFLIRLPKKVKKFSLIRSPHVYKKSREQLEVLSYNRILHLEGSEESLEKIITKTIVKNKHAFFFKLKWQYSTNKSCE